MREYEDIEAYLREFTPRAPSSPLLRPQRRWPHMFVFRAAAAVIAVSGVVSVMPGSPSRVRPHKTASGLRGPAVRPVTAGELWRFVRQGGAVPLDATLAALSPHTLVGVQRPDGQLQILAKE
jgi:hypothetical protein